jgi:hypothetical protein
MHSSLTEQILLNQAGCEARKIPANGGVFFLDFYLYRTLPSVPHRRSDSDFWAARQGSSRFLLRSPDETMGSICCRDHAVGSWNGNKPTELARSGSLSGAEKENFEPPEWDF